MPPGAKLHQSVLRRLADEPSYRAKVPDGVVWVDEDWTTLKAPVSALGPHVTGGRGEVT